MTPDTTLVGDESAVMNLSEKSSPQKHRVRLTVVVCLLFITVVLLGFINKITTPRLLNEVELRVNGAIEFPQPRIFDDFSLTDHRGRPFTLEDFKGKWSLVFFGFSHCPDVCPTGLASLNNLMKNIDPDVAAQTQVVMVTLDPARDTPEKLAAYVPYFNRDFIGLSGDFLTIKRLANQLNVAFAKVTTDADSGDYTVDHSGNIVLVNPYGHYHGFFKPPFDLARLKLTYQSIYQLFETD